MSVKIRITAALLLTFIMLSLCSCAIRIEPPRDLSSEEEAVNMGFSACAYNDTIAVGEYMYLSVNIKLDYEEEVRWSSSDTTIATVDSNGRVDGIQEGSAVIIASAKSASIEYPVSITKAAKTTTSYSTAIVANEDSIETNKGLSSNKNLYGIVVNTYNCCVTVFTYDGDNYNIPVRAMACAVGSKDSTPIMQDVVTDKADWVYLSDKKYYRYATYIGEDLMFQSSPYSEQKADTLIADEYNEIGTAATAKNIRLSVADAKWIYDNCNESTMVRIVNSDNVNKFSPLGVPASLELTENSKTLKWDPTDKSEDNPYNKLKPVISGAEDIVIEVSKGFDLYSGVTATDTCGADITDKIVTDGEFNRNRTGEYVVSYYVTDIMNRTTRVDRHIIVVEDIEEYTSAVATE